MAQANWIAESNQQGAALGYAVASAGDANGDEIDDVIIGASSHRGRTGNGEGRVFVFFGSRAGLQLEPAWIWWEERHRLFLGRVVAGAGDLNGDGFDDVLAGTFGEQSSREDSRVSVFAGSSVGVLPNKRGEMPHRITARRVQPPPPPLWSQAWFWAVVGVTLTALAATGWHTLATMRLRRQLRIAEQEGMIERERTRIAQDLHDHLGSNLASITLLSEVARRDLLVPGKVEAHLSSLANTARSLTRELEEIVWAVNPRKDKLDQLVSFFSAYAEEFLRPTNLRCRLDFPDELAEQVVPAEVRHDLFLVFKEALTNVVKHAGATEVRIRLALEKGMLALTIEDDGCGFDLPAVRPERNGLENILSRIGKLGGHCQFSSQREKGTRVEVRVRLQPQLGI